MTPKHKWLGPLALIFLCVFFLFLGIRLFSREPAMSEESANALSNISKVIRTDFYSIDKRDLLETLVNAKEKKLLIGLKRSQFENVLGPSIQGGRIGLKHGKNDAIYILGRVPDNVAAGPIELIVRFGPDGVCIGIDWIEGAN